MVNVHHLHLYSKALYYRKKKLKSIIGIKTYFCLNNAVPPRPKRALSSLSCL